MPVPQSKVGPGILTASDAKLVVFRGLYAPKGWPNLAQGGLLGKLIGRE